MGEFCLIQCALKLEEWWQFCKSGSKATESPQAVIGCCDHYTEKMIEN
jgi:hypothetical protein